MIDGILIAGANRGGSTCTVLVEEFAALDVSETLICYRGGALWTGSSYWNHSPLTDTSVAALSLKNLLKVAMST